MNTAPHGPEWLAYLTAETGTDKWVCAPRLTPYLRSKGYTVALPPKRWAALETAFNALWAAAKAERVALALFPDDYHDGHDCRSEIDRVGESCRVCADNFATWRNRVESVRLALTAENLL